MGLKYIEEYLRAQNTYGSHDEVIVALTRRIAADFAQAVSGFRLSGFPKLTHHICKIEPARLCRPRWLCARMSGSSGQCAVKKWKLFVRYVSIPGRVTAGASPLLANLSAC